MIQPSAIYYLILYALIVVLQFFKTYPQVKDEPSRFNWRHYFFVSLEVVYTSAGVAILLVAQEKDWIAVIMMVYVMLVVISSFLDTVGTRFRDNTRLTIHTLIIVSVVVGTLLAYGKWLPSSGAEEAKRREALLQPRQFIVALPYLDRTLEQHVGVGRMDSRMLLYKTTVVGLSRSDAVTKAKEKALSTGPEALTPFAPKQTTRQGFVLLPDEAVVEELAARGEKSERR